MPSLVEIDGSVGEGGGQVLRTSLALAALLSKPVRIYNIRAKREKPGLRPQHLNSVKVIAALADAEVEGLRVGSTEITFIPRELRGGTYTIDIGTAGSVTLIIQAIAPIAAFLPSGLEVRIIGGTDVPKSPTIDYMRNVFTHFMGLMGYTVEIEVKRRGHYPRGGGMVVFRVPNPPKSLEPIEIVDQGRLKEVRGISHAVKLPRHVAVRQAKSASETLVRTLKVMPDITVEWYEPSRDPHRGPGSGVTLWAILDRTVMGSDALGERGKPAEAVGREAANKLVEDLGTGAALDRHMSDMIIPYLALADGSSIITGARLTMHAYTNLLVTKRFVGEAVYEVKGDINEPFKLKIRGIGYST